MLAQFQARYPTGSLISELLSIYQGKFVVRVSAQVEGITRATGMAGAETPELAEDRARERALAVLAIGTQSSMSETTSQLSSDAPQQAIQINPIVSPELITQMNRSQANPISKLNDSTYLSVAPSPLAELTPEGAVSPAFKENSRLTVSAAANQEPNVLEFEMADNLQSNSSNPPSFSKVMPLVPRSHNPEESATTPGETLAEKITTSEPIDLSDAIARTSVELKRLGWNNQQGREYLEQTYGKRSRQHLNDQELLEFLHYLESLPSR